MMPAVEGALCAAALAAGWSLHVCASRLRRPPGAGTARSTTRLRHNAAAAEPVPPCGELPVVVARMGTAGDLALEMERAARRSAEAALEIAYARYGAVLEPRALAAPPAIAHDDARPVEIAPACVRDDPAANEPGVVAPQRVFGSVRREPAGVAEQPPSPARTGVHLQIGPAWSSRV